METTYETNRKSLANYFAASSKQCAKRIGIELEHFLVFDDGSSAHYYGEHGVLEVLKELQPKFKSYYVNEMLLGLYNADFSISLEPSAQFEISVTPQEKIERIEEIYEKFIRLLKPVAQRNKLHIETLGYRPSGSVYNLPLIPKKRYEFMDRYFKCSGTHGINMMRGTAATQISVDYSSEEDFVRKYRFAYMLMPALKLICDNTPVFEGKKNETPLKRTFVWRNTDNERCEPPADIFNEGFGFASYADYILNVPVIFVFENGRETYVGSKSMAQLCENRELTKDEIEHALSMVFPDVRLKTYIEIRGADSLPIKEALGYAALLKALIYSKDTVEKYLSKYKICRADIKVSEDSLMQNGSDGLIYGESADEFIECLFGEAKANISDDERHYLEALEAFYNKNRKK